MQDLIVLIIGIVAGNVTGLVGASGVMVVVPAFILLGCTSSDAIGASLFIDTIASLIVSWTYYQHQNLALKQGIWIAIGSIAGAQFGSLFASIVPDMGLKNSFSAFLFVSAIILWINGKKSLVPDEENVNKQQKKHRVIGVLRKNPRVFGVILGCLVGIISGLLGAGGGIMILFILIFVMKFNIHEGIGTSTLIMAFTAASGAIGHIITSNLPFRIAIVGSLGTVIGGRIAAKYANKVDENILYKVAAILFLVLSIALAIINREIG